MVIINLFSIFTIMTSECARETVETIDRSTVQDEYSMTSEHAWETVEIIDRSTVAFRGPFYNFRKQQKIPNYIYTTL